MARPGTALKEERMRKRVTVGRHVFGWMLLVLAVASALPARAQGRVADPCAAELDAFGCRRHRERRAVDAWPTRVLREGGTLTLRLEGGRALSLQDRPATTGGTGETDRALSFVFREYLPAIGYYVVELGYPEGGAFMLVNARTGRETQLGGEPVVAPGGRRLVEASQADEGGRGPRQVSVWRLDADGPAREWTFSPPETDPWDPADPVWTDASTVRFTKRVADPARLSLRETPMVLRLTADGWRMTSAR
jgi:hypothetical protein